MLIINYSGPHIKGFRAVLLSIERSCSERPGREACRLLQPPAAVAHLGHQGGS